MGLGGIVLLILLGLALLNILVCEKVFSPRTREESSPFAGLPKISLHLASPPEEVVQRLTPPWQGPLREKLLQEGYLPLGNFSFPSMLFFWASPFISPDGKSVLLLVHWVEGKDGGKVVINNLEIYSFCGNSFLLTACAQDGAAKLLTGANRPTAEQLSLHLKSVYAESSVRPIILEHQKRLADWEQRGISVRPLTKENVLPSLSKIFS
jgi:hypothetical protein